MEAAPYKAASARPPTTHHENYQRYTNQIWGKLQEKYGRTHKWRNPMDPFHMDKQRQDDHLEPTYDSSVPIHDVPLKTCRKQSTVGRGGERGSGISVLMVRRDDDDDIYIYANCDVEDDIFNLKKSQTN